MSACSDVRMFKYLLSLARQSRVPATALGIKSRTVWKCSKLLNSNCCSKLPAASVRSRLICNFLSGCVRHASRKCDLVERECVQGKKNIKNDLPWHFQWKYIKMWTMRARDTKSEPKDAKSEPTGRQSEPNEPKVSQKRPKREPKGVKRETQAICLKTGTGLRDLVR